MSIQEVRGALATIGEWVDEALHLLHSASSPLDEAGTGLASATRTSTRIEVTNLTQAIQLAGERLQEATAALTTAGHQLEQFAERL